MYSLYSVDDEHHELRHNDEVVRVFESWKDAAAELHKIRTKQARRKVLMSALVHAVTEAEKYAETLRKLESEGE